MAKRELFEKVDAINAEADENARREERRRDKRRRATEAEAFRVVPVKCVLCGDRVSRSSTVMLDIGPACGRHKGVTP